MAWLGRAPTNGGDWKSMRGEPAVPIVIVAFRGLEDVVPCLEALANAQPEPAFDVYVCENGGPEAFDALCAALGQRQTEFTSIADAPPVLGSDFERHCAFAMNGRPSRIFVGQARENLGYAGGVNSWLRPLLSIDWPGAMILNPDTKPAPDVLAQLKAWAQTRGRGMVGGCVALLDEPDTIQLRGLKWRKLMGKTMAVGRREPLSARWDPDRIEAELDAPSGALIYVTRACVDDIGLMPEHYFLYYEDVAWGLKAKMRHGLGYAFDAVIYHKGGGSIGSGTRRAPASPFSTYLDFRNRLLFVRDVMPGWLPWTAFTSIGHLLRFVAGRRWANSRAAARGWIDGLAGRTGRPDQMLARHLSR
jgi:N-acetylglucosaminyl-diphospho-decaprenol L-rhamnosyltransferase